MKKKCPRCKEEMYQEYMKLGYCEDCYDDLTSMDAEDAIKELLK